MSLTARQADFVQQYLVDLNVAQAWIRAGGSAASARQDGHRAFKLETVQAAIQAAMAARATRLEITQDEVAAGLAQIARASLADVTDWGVKEVAVGFDADGKKVAPEDIGEAAVVRYADAPFVRPVNRDDLPPEIRAAVAEVALTKDGFRIKMHDKVGALTQLGRHLGMFTEKVEMTGKDGAPIVPVLNVTIGRTEP